MFASPGNKLLDAGDDTLLILNAAFAVQAEYFCFRMDERAFFVYGYPKSSRANISDDQERALKKLAGVLLNLPDDTLQAMLADNSLIEF